MTDGLELLGSALAPVQVEFQGQTRFYPVLRTEWLEDQGLQPEEGIVYMTRYPLTFDDNPVYMYLMTIQLVSGYFIQTKMADWNGVYDEMARRIGETFSQPEIPLTARLEAEGSLLSRVAAKRIKELEREVSRLNSDIGWMTYPDRQ